jgi:hypothetical protein
MAVLNTGLATPARGFTIDYSCRFNDGDSAYLSRTPASAGNRRTFTWSAWFKHGAMDGSFTFISAVDDNLMWQHDSGEPRMVRYEHSADGAIGSVGFSRDPSAWYHIMWVVDTTDTSPASNKKKLYINGVRFDDTSGGSYGDNNREQSFNNNTVQYIGSNTTPGGSLFDGYLAEVHMIDGTALTPSSFGETGDYGEWKPKEYDTADGAYGTCGYYLDFADSAALGNDVSGNNNDWTVTNLTAVDQMLDTPTNNFCTFSPIDHALGDAGTLSEGNLKWVNGSDDTVRGTLAVTSGKWYFEAIPKTTVDGSNPIMFGIMGTTGLPAHSGMDRANYIYSDNGSNHGIYHVEAGSASTATVTAFTSLSVDDVLGMAFDMDTGKIWLSMGGTWLDSGDPAAGSNPAYTMATTGDIPMTIGADHAGVTYTVIYNCGQDSSFAGNKTAQGNGDAGDDFYYTPPSGFKSLKTSNLPTPAVTPSEHFNTVLYTGNATSNSITGVGFQPDLIWAKCIWPGYSHGVYDVLRGAGNFLVTNTTAAAVQNASGYGMTSFDSDGFSTGTNQYNLVASANNYVAWNWLANGSGSSNTDGDIASTVSANTDAGFSIVSWSGSGNNNDTVGHGLSSAPEMVICKRRNNGTDQWAAYHADLGQGFLQPNTSDDYDTATDRWGTNAPTSTVMNLGYAGSTNNGSGTYIAYMFHSVDGYSKVGSYTGNGNADGTFVYTGFKPAYVLLKITDDTNNWFIFDNKRDTYNVAEHRLYASTSDSEATGLNTMDMLSNGFKFRDTNLAWNASGNNYIYIAFAEIPFRYANAR